jgi:hypothetical protein
MKSFYKIAHQLAEASKYIEFYVWPVGFCLIQKRGYSTTILLDSTAPPVAVLMITEVQVVL